MQSESHGAASRNAVDSGRRNEAWAVRGRLTTDYDVCIAVLVLRNIYTVPPLIPGVSSVWGFRVQRMGHHISREITSKFKLL